MCDCEDLWVHIWVTAVQQQSFSKMIVVLNKSRVLNIMRLWAVSNSLNIGLVKKI